MTTIKYASDLTVEDKIIDRHTHRVIIIEKFLEPTEPDTVVVSGYYEDNGDDWSPVLDADAQMKVV
jgi:hypothetical protein